MILDNIFVAFNDQTLHKRMKIYKISSKKFNLSFCFKKTYEIILNDFICLYKLI